MKSFDEIAALKNQSSAAIQRMHDNIDTLNETIDRLEKDSTRSREFIADAVKAARERVLPILSSELDKIRELWTVAAAEQKYWESTPLILSRLKFDEDLARDATIKMGLREEYAAMAGPLLQLSFESARDEADLPRMWAIFTAGQRLIESNAGFAKAFDASMDGLEVPDRAAVLARIAVCESNLSHGEMLFATASGLRINPLRKMQVGRLQAQSSRLVAAAAGIGPAD